MATEANRILKTSNIAPVGGERVTETIPLGSHIADLVTTLPANSAFTNLVTDLDALTFSATPTQAEVEALRDGVSDVVTELENVRDAVAEIRDAFNTFKKVFEASGAAPVFEDAP